MIKRFDFLSPIPRFECPICGTDYDKYASASDCQDSHGTASQLLGYKWHNADHNCPESVYIELSDGRIMEYKLFSEYAKEEEASEALSIEPVL